MTNLFKRFFTHKSKFLLIILCLLGMVFSYSCSCRNETTKPPVTDDNGDTLTGGRNNNKGGTEYDPDTVLSRGFMVVNSAGTDTSYPIDITVNNARYDLTFSGDLTADDFDLTTRGTIKIKTDKLTSITSDKNVTITVNYKNNSLMGENDTLSKQKDDFPITVKRATKVEKNEIMQKFKTALNLQIGEHIFKGDAPATKLENTTITMTTEKVDGEDTDLLSVGGFKEKTIDKLTGNAELKKYFDDGGITLKDGYTGKDTQIASYRVLYTPKPEYEIDTPNSFLIELKIMKGKWTD